MLDALKGLTGGGKAQKQAEELAALIQTAREERSALSAMLTQVSGATLSSLRFGIRPRSRRLSVSSGSPPRTSVWIARPL